MELMLLCRPAMVPERNKVCWVSGLNRRPAKPADGANPPFRPFESDTHRPDSKEYCVANVLDFLDFVNRQASFHEKRAAQTKNDSINPKRSPKHLETAGRFRDLAAAIQDAGAKIASIPVMPPPESPALTLRPEDLTGLPPEVLAQLNISETDKLEATIVEVVNEAGGTIILDKLIIGLYRKTGDIAVRQQLVNRLYRMSKKGMVYSVKGKKGIYTTNAALGSTPEEGSDDNT